MSRSPWVRLAALALLAGGLVLGQTATSEASGTSPASHAVTAKKKAMTGAPKVGRCYDVPGKDAWNFDIITAHTVSCHTSHTLWVYRVTEVPASITLPSRSAGDESPAFQRFQIGQCGGHLGKAIGKIGRSYGFSSYMGFYAAPTMGQRKKGARWLSCEVGIISRKKALAHTTWRKPKHLSAHLPALLTICATASYDLTNCAKKHAYRARYVRFFNAAPDRVGHKLTTICDNKVNGWYVPEWRSVGNAAGSTDRYVATCMPKNHH